MSPSELNDIRQKVKDRHAVLESVPGSGWHANDTGSPAKRGELPLSQRPVAIHDEYEVFFVGDCVPQVLGGLKRCAAQLQQIEGHLPAEKKILRFAAEMLAAHEEMPAQTVPILAIRAQQWNDCALALEIAGIQVASTGVNQ